MRRVSRPKARAHFRRDVPEDHQRAAHSALSWSVISEFLLPRCYVRADRSEYVRANRLSLLVIPFELRRACADNRVTRFRRFPAISGDRLGLTDRLIRSQTSVDCSLCDSDERRPIGDAIGIGALADVARCPRHRPMPPNFNRQRGGLYENDLLVTQRRC